MWTYHIAQIKPKLKQTFLVIMLWGIFRPVVLLVDVVNRHNFQENRQKHSFGTFLLEIQNGVIKETYRYVHLKTSLYSQPDEKLKPALFIDLLLIECLLKGGYDMLLEKPGMFTISDTTDKIILRSLLSDTQLLWEPSEKKTVPLLHIFCHFKNDQSLWRGKPFGLNPLWCQ